MDKIMQELQEVTNREADTPEQKYTQLKEFFKQNSTDYKTGISMTIKHSMSQSALVGGYCGFDSDFWTSVMREFLNDN